MALRPSAPSSQRWLLTSNPPHTVLRRCFARKTQNYSRFVPRGQRKRTLAEADKKRIQKALEKKKDAPQQKTGMWYDNNEKLWSYRKDKWGVAAQRAAPLIVLGCILSYSPEANDFFYRYLFPLQVEMLYGASMLPTVHPYGDTWLHTTPLWDTLRRPYNFLKSMITGKQSPLYEKGEIVIWRETQNNRRACKRIIGVEGDEVRRFGEHSEYYGHRSDLGIRWESLMVRGLDPTCPWDDDQPLLPYDKDDRNRTLIVPAGHVWLEGDNPLVCVDSRHYGPVPIDLVEGKLIWRLFPLLRNVNIRKYDQKLRGEPKVRPPPLDLEKPKQRGEEDILAAYYNLYRLPKEQKETPPPEMQDEFSAS